MINVKNVYYYLTKNFYALFDVSLNVAKGEKIVLFGQTDSGKTSLLRIILGLTKATKGEVLLNGKNPKDIDFKNDLKVLFISSKGAFYENRSCYYNLEKICKIRKQKPDFIKINSLLQTFGLYSYKDTKAKDLNAFNRVMLQLARASLRDKYDLIIVDDVFENLAYAEAEHVIKHLKSFISQRGVTSLCAVSKEELVSKLGKRVIKLNLGTIEEKEEKVAK